MDPISNNDIRGEALLKSLIPFVCDYLKEIRSPTKPEQFISDLTLVPIMLKGETVGFWAIKLRSHPDGEIAVIKAAYIRPSNRGRLLGRFVDVLMDGLAKRGVKGIEIWAFPEMKRWLERRYKIKTQIYVMQTPIEAFLNFDRASIKNHR